MDTEARNEKSGISRNLVRRRWTVLLLYLGVLVAAEVFIAAGVSIGRTDIAMGTLYTSAGLTIHILLVFALIFFAVFIVERDRPFALFLPAMSLASLDRILSLSTPPYQFSTLQWLGLVSIPLLTAAGSVAYVLGLRIKDLGLGPLTLSGVGVQAAVGSTGLALGVVEFFILGPAIPPWLPQWTLSGFAFGVVVMFFATGLSEELIFRAILLRKAVEAMGSRLGLLFVTGVFATLHLFYASPADLVFVFGVGLFYGLIVLRTNRLWGVIISHTIANAVLYLVAPFVIR
jgi:membrane protease YdiL (CAAX protease family)